MRRVQENPQIAVDLLSALRKSAANLQVASQLIQRPSASEQIAACAFLARQQIAKCEPKVYSDTMDGTDRCFLCGIDLRDDIHLRASEPAKGGG